VAKRNLVQDDGVVEELLAASVARMGVKDTEVITPRLVQDERGWVRLAS
jgi:hypothetical protein